MLILKIPFALESLTIIHILCGCFPTMPGCPTCVRSKWIVFITLRLVRLKMTRPPTKYLSASSYGTIRFSTFRGLLHHRQEHWLNIDWLQLIGHCAYSSHPLSIYQHHHTVPSGSPHSGDYYIIGKNID